MIKMQLKYLVMIIAVLNIGSVTILGGMKFLARPQHEVCTIRSDEQKVTSNEFGIGWSTSSDPDKATKDAVGMALTGKKYKQPTFALVFGAAENNAQGILDRVRKILGDKTKIYGCVAKYGDPVSDKAALTKADKRSGKKEGSILIVTISSPDIKFGVGSADISASSSCGAAKVATEKAVENSGADQKKLPKIVLLTPIAGQEAQTVKGVREVVGDANIIVCGASGDSGVKVFGEKKAYANGVSLAVIYTNLPIGYSLIKRAFANLEKPDAITQLLIWRCPHTELNFI